MGKQADIKSHRAVGLDLLDHRGGRIAVLMQFDDPNGRHDPAETNAQPVHQFARHGCHMGPQGRNIGDRPIGAQSRRHQGNRQNMSGRLFQRSSLSIRPTGGRVKVAGKLGLVPKASGCYNLRI